MGGERLDYIFTTTWRRISSRGGARWTSRSAEGKIRTGLDIRTLFFLLTDGGAGPYTSQALARRIGGPDPLRPAAIRAHAELVADVLLNGIVAS